MKRKKRLLCIMLLLLLALAGCKAREQNDPSSAGRDPAAEADAAISEQGTETISSPAEPTDALKTAGADQWDLMEVHFLDVGQGDCTLIKCGESAMLIDTSTPDQGTAIQNYLSKNGVEKLDYLILTHPDSDHIGSAPTIITKFEIDKVFMSNFEKDNKTYQKVIQALDDKSLTYSTPQPGTVYSLGTAEFTILAPVADYSDPNNASIALLLKNGENSFLFTGDAEEEAEADILAAGRPLEADVYQAGHHGSKTSSSEVFLDAVAPEFAVISCEEGNSYGFPHAKTLNNFRSRGILVYRTDEQGTILAVSDGKEITWNAAPSDTWQSGEPGSSGKKEGSEPTAVPPVKTVYILNTKTMKFHHTDCNSLPETNREETDKSREELIQEGYDPCKRCNP